MDKSNYRILMIAINGAWKHGNIGIDQLAGYLRDQGFNVDMGYYHKRDNISDIFEKIKGRYDFYGFSVTSSNYKNCIELSDMLKEHDSSVIIDYGGGYVTRYYREVFSEVDNLDYIVLGDGEEPTEYLLNSLINDSDYHNAKETAHISIASRNDLKNKIQHLNGKVSHLPVFDYYENDTLNRNSRKVHCIQTKNNVCTGNCSFCTERHGRVVYKDIDSIIDQIKIVHDNYGIHKIFFTDDNIFDPNDEKGREHVRKLCLALKEMNIKMAYQCYCKAISLKDTPEDHAILSLMKEVGFVEVFVGIESANQDDLNLYNKFTTVEDNYTIIRLLKQHKLTPIMGFIGFNPYTTLKKMKDNFRFLCDVKCTYLPNYLYTFVNVNKYTSLYERIKKDGLILSGDDEYINIKYAYQDKEVSEILVYIEEEMLPKLNMVQYELDWVMYSYEECLIWCNDVIDYDEILKEYKEKDFEVIKKYLGILFLDNDLCKFKEVEHLFWKHFELRQEPLKKIYDYLIQLHIDANTEKKLHCRRD